jgi:hypothetical protein
MARSVLSVRPAITALVVLTLAASCGHRSETWEAYRNAHSSTPNASTAGAGNAGSGNAGSDNAGNLAGTGNALPQFACTAVASQQFDVAYMQAYSESPEVTQAAAMTMSWMGPAEKASQMIGIPVGNMDYQDIERSPDVVAPGVGTIRGYNYRDAGRGVNLDAGQKNRQNDGNNSATVFPAPSLRAASWDLDLEKRIGAAIGDETAASLNNMLLAPCMNIIRDPYWGRTQETYSEDSYHTGHMATAFTVGLQEYVTGCAKHFAANNIEKGRSTQNLSA